jgi:hypothetical protein
MHVLYLVYCAQSSDTFEAAELSEHDDGLLLTSTRRKRVAKMNKHKWKKRKKRERMRSEKRKTA